MSRPTPESRGVRRSSRARERIVNDQHRFEHWYRSNQVYFITGRCNDGHPAFDAEDAKAVFWDRFEHYAREGGFTPWVTSLLSNHYHTIGYLRIGERDEVQCRRAYRYVLTQSVRHGLCRDWREYAHTRVRIDLELGLKRALELNAFLEGVPYKRYDGREEKSGPLRH